MGGDASAGMQVKACAVRAKVAQRLPWAAKRPGAVFFRRDVGVFNLTDGEHVVLTPGDLTHDGL